MLCFDGKTCLRFPRSPLDLSAILVGNLRFCSTSLWVSYKYFCFCQKIKNLDPGYYWCFGHNSVGLFVKLRIQGWNQLLTNGCSVSDYCLWTRYITLLILKYRRQIPKYKISTCNQSRCITWGVAYGFLTHNGSPAPGSQPGMSTGVRPGPLPDVGFLLFPRCSSHSTPIANQIIHQYKQTYLAVAVKTHPSAFHPSDSDTCITAACDQSVLPSRLESKPILFNILLKLFEKGYCWWWERSFSLKKIVLQSQKLEVVVEIFNFLMVSQSQKKWSLSLKKVKTIYKPWQSVMLDCVELFLSRLWLIVEPYSPNNNTKTKNKNPQKKWQKVNMIDFLSFGRKENIDGFVVVKYLVLSLFLKLWNVHVCIFFIFDVTDWMMDGFVDIVLFSFCMFLINYAFYLLSNLFYLYHLYYLFWLLSSHHQHPTFTTAVGHLLFLSTRKDNRKTVSNNN